MICDSNIIIYATDPADTNCATFVVREESCIASVTLIEVLGFRGFDSLSEAHRMRLTKLVTSMVKVELDDNVIQQAIVLRQRQRMSLADAIIAATALTRKVPLVTRNEEDFKNIPNLQVINPFMGDQR